MVEIKVDASKIKGEGSDMLQELAKFLQEKTAAEVKNEGGKMTVKTEAKGVNKKYMRVLLKKFLHQQELKEYYRVTGGEEDTLRISERRVYEEE